MAAAASRPGNAGTDPGRRAQQDLPAIRQRPVRALAHRLRLSDPAHLYGLPWLQWNGRRPCCSTWARASSATVRPGAVAAGRGLPGGAAGDLGAGAVPVHRRGRPAVLRLRLSADRHTEIFMDRAQGRRRPRGPHPPGRVALVLAQGAVEDHKHFLWIALACGGLARPSSVTSRPSANWDMNCSPCSLVLAVVLDGVLRIRHLGQRGLHARVGLQVHVPYARFQSVMVDPDTFVVTYDKRRGDPRGGRSRKVDHKGRRPGRLRRLQPVRAGLSDRHRHPRRLQYMCIGCGALSTPASR